MPALHDLFRKFINFFYKPQYFIFRCIIINIKLHPCLLLASTRDFFKINFIRSNMVIVHS